MLKNKKRHSFLLLVLCALNFFQTGVILALADSGETTASPKSLKLGVSEVLDSPEPLAFRQVTKFITENFGVLKLDDFDRIKANSDDQIPLWNIRARFKQSARETEVLAEKLAHTPDAEQYALAAKLTEYEEGFDALNPQKPKKDIVSVDLLRELQFLNGDNNSILKSISHLTTKGGEIAMTALVAKCNDNLDVIKQRRNFIKTLIENPTLLNKLQDQLEIIKASEPLLFSNYRQFKRDRLNAFVKGGMIKAIFKQMWPNSYRAERAATNTELVWKPMLSIAASGVVSAFSLWDLCSTWWSFKDEHGLSSIGSTIKNAIDTGKKWGKGLQLPHKAIHHFLNKWSWNDFMEEKVLRSESLRNHTQKAQAQHATTEEQKWWFKRTPFLEKMRDDFIEKYTVSKTPATNNHFHLNDKDMHIVFELIKELRRKHLDKINLPDLQLKKETSLVTTPSSSREPDKTLDSYANIDGWFKTNTTELVKQHYGISHENRIYNIFAIFAVLGMLVVMLPQMEMGYKSYMDNYLDLKNLFNSVQAPHAVYKAGKQIHKLLADTEQTAHLYPNFIPSTSKEWLSFLELVQSGTFASSFGPGGMPFKDHGKVVQAYHLLMQSQEEIGELIRFYGELDSYVSMAKLVQEFEDENNNEGAPTRYSFVDFEENSDYPRFEAIHYWNPMFSAKRAVPNHMNIGQDGKARGIIVTGANAGGKSGNIKAILTSIILAQTFGIASAEKLKMTVFSFIQATLKSNDDTANNKSRFQVEALDMARVMQRVISLPKDKFCAIFSDELFAGTEVEPAIALTRRICLSIAGMDNVMYILATHYKDLTKLELMTDGIFKNFKVEVIKLPDGTLHRPYKLIEGIGGTNIAFDVFIEQLGELGMKEGYLHNMVKQAKDDQTMQELLNPIKTIGVEASFTNRNDW